MKIAQKNMKKTTFLIVGKHAVLEALKNPSRKIERVFLTEDAQKKLNRENQSQNLLSRLSLLKENQINGNIKAPDIKMDNKDFGIGAQILHDLNIHKLNLISNSEQHEKRVGMIGYGLEIVGYTSYK